MKKQTRLLLCFLTILLALGLSACSGNGENPAESTGADSRPEESTASTTDNKTEKPGDDSDEGTTGTETSGAETGGEETTEQDPLSDVMKRLLSDDERLTPFDRDRVKTTVNVVDKGVKANDVSAADRNLTLINRLISSAGEYTEIYFPAGTYYIAPTRLSGGIRLEGKKNILLRGENATLVNTSYSSRNGKNTAFYNTGNLLRTYGCENVTVEGLTLDYLVHTTAEGTVEKIEGGYTYIRLYGDWYTAEGKTPLSGGELPFCVNLIGADGIPTSEWYLDMSKDILLEKQEDTLFRISGSYGKKGDRISVRLGSSAFAQATLLFERTAGLTVRDVTVNSCPGTVCMVPAGNRDFRFERYTVKTAASSPLYFAANADSIHTSGLRGKLELIDCVFDGLGDDALNIHSMLAGISALNGTQLTVTNAASGGAPDALWCQKGDTLEFFDAKMRSLGTATVVSFSGSALLVDTLPGGVDTTCSIQNVSSTPDTYISGCSVRHGRARAFLLQTKNAVITDCTFSDLRLPAVIIAPDFDDWHEAGFGENILIRNSSFTRCGADAVCRSYGAIYISGCHDFKTFPANGVIGHGNITVLGNTFTDCPTYAVYRRSVRNLIFRSNTVTGCRGEIGK